MIPFKISLPRQQEQPLFDYPHFIMSVTEIINDEIENWLSHRFDLTHVASKGLYELANAVNYQASTNQQKISSINRSTYEHTAIDTLMTFLNDNSTLISLNLKSSRLGTEEQNVNQATL